MAARLNLDRVEFFRTHARDHIFYFSFDPGNGAIATIPVVTGPVDGLDELYARGHENLVTILELVLQQAREVARHYRESAQKKV